MFVEFELINVIVHKWVLLQSDKAWVLEQSLHVKV